MDEVVNPNIKCSICGENEFEQREGFYYCLECGTKQEQVRQVEVDNEDAFNDTAGTKHSKSIKIKVVKAEKPQLTSWEIYNYILRGYVEELLSFGANEELKLMALQVWAAYLRRMEVAFFNKKQADLPKLGVRYFRNDAETIYNHSKEMRKKNKKKRGDETSCTSGGEETSGRKWRKSKRKLDESIYSSMNSATSASSTSANSNKAIKLAFNMKARKFLKKKMPVKHLLRHEMDAEGLMLCHGQPKVNELKRLEYLVSVLNIKQIYSILAIALNLIGDEIQLTDLVRFIQEGHIGWKNVLQYFPENIASNGREMLMNIDFYRFSEKYTEKSLRDHVSLLSKNIGIRKFRTPDIIALVQRYVTELCLPQEIRTYAERLINFFPPRFEIRQEVMYPAYEARAMAYIIFIMKLLFGLDGHKEQQMSVASRKLNHKIKELNRKNAENRPLLFVWDEWLQYIEMRKVIVSRYNPTFCRQFGQCESTAQILEQMSEDIRRKEEQEQTQNEKTPKRMIKQKMNSFKYLFDTFLENYAKTNEGDPALNVTTSAMPHIEFNTTYTPGLTYFKKILLHCDNHNDTAGENNLKIPHFMHTDHTKRDMQAYLEVRPLVDYFQNNHMDLKVISLGTTKDRQYTGIFHAHTPLFRNTRPQQANFDVSEEVWTEIVEKENAFNTDDLAWKTDLEPFADKYIGNKMRYIRRKRAAANNREELEPDPDVGITIRESKNNAEVETTFARNIYNEAISIHVFNENNMDPLQTENDITVPRRDLGRTNIFLDIDDEDSLIDNNESFPCNSGRNDTLLSSRAASPSQESAEFHIKSEFIPESSNQDPETLKFYTSNMDCWMLFGKLFKLTKPQRKQLQEKLPLGFFWLLETCAQTLGVNWSVVYEQLLVIEMMFCLGIEDLDKVQNCVYINYLHPIKDFEQRKLDESIYSSMNSATSASSTSANSNKAIKLAFNMKARKFLKKKMPVKHLLRHEMDAEGLMLCHGQPKVNELKRLEYLVSVLNIKQIYSILAIALNLIGDEIQLTDLVRFIQEGHIGWKNVLQYFPENIASNGREMLMNIDFYRFSEKYTEKSLRDHVSLLSKNIGIRKFRTPDIIALVQRYVTELCLPQEIRTYAERLINFFPPRFEIRQEVMYPAYEARAMAYIIFIMKLLFGLDGHKEQQMSVASRKLNHKIKELNRKNAENRPLLFVWDEWLQYIEMRKVIVSRYNPTFCRQFGQCESTAQILEQMSEDIRRKEEQEQTQNEKTPKRMIKQKMNSFKYLFDTFLENYAKTNEGDPALNVTTSAMPHIEFNTTYTPGLTYFKKILLHCDNHNDTAGENNLKIPHFMHTDHTKRDMQAYLEVRPLVDYFQNNHMDLKVISLGTTKDRQYTGIFHAHTPLFRNTRPQQANFDVSEEVWTEIVEKENAFNTDDLAWKTDLEPFADKYIGNKMRYIRRKRAAANNREELEPDPDVGITIRESKNNAEVETTFARNIYNEAISIHVFNENNMDPLQTENDITVPRRDLGRTNIFLDIDDEDSLIDNNESFPCNSGRNDTLLSSRAASPSQESAEFHIKSEFIPESSNQDPETLKFYTSNMDCWMLFGKLFKLTKPQRKQLQEKLPLGFFWLLETCAQTLGVNWSVVYEQLLVIEMMFCLGIEDLDKVQNCVYINYLHPIKDFEQILCRQNCFRNPDREFIPESSNQDPETLKFYTSNMDCWMLFGKLFKLTKPQRKQLQEKLPLGFFWLLETCAQTLGVNWSVVYEQLLVIEMMFCLGIEDLDKVQNCVYINYLHPIKDFEQVIKAHRDIW